MNTCIEYQSCKDIIACASDIVIGEIDTPNSPVYVHLIDTATDKRRFYEAESDESGVVTLDASEIPLMNGRTYQVYLTGMDDLNTFLNITIGSCIYNVLQFRCYYSNIHPETQTLAIDD